MRRAGQNPTDIEVQDLLNKIDDGSGTLNVDDFLVVMRESSRDIDGEIHFKDAFRAFSKDKDGALFYFPYSSFTFHIFCLNSKHNSHIRLYSCCRTEVCNESSSRTGRYSFWDAYLVSVPFSQSLLVSNQCYKHYKSDRIAFPGLSSLWPWFHSSNESPFHFVEVPLGEIDEMISTVDKNKDGKISYSEFR